MVELIGVACVSTAGWLISLGCSRSAARRHLVLMSALAACLLLPVALHVRAETEWTLLSLRTTNATGGALSVPAEHSIERNQPLLRAEQAESASTAAVMVQSASGVPGGDDSIHSSAALPAATRDAATRDPSGTGSSGPSEPQAANWRIAAMWWGRLFYLAVAAVLLLRVGASFVAVLRVSRRAVPVDTFAEGIRVLEADVAVPLATGFGRRAIVLPRGFRAAVKPEELLDVLAHEAEHLRRRDHWVIVVQRLVAAAWWPIVTVHLLNRALDRAREELCDNAVLAGRDAAAYGQTLLAVTEHLSHRHGSAPLLAPSVIGQGELERRVAGILDERRDRRTQISRRVRWGVAACLIAAGVIAGTTRVVAVAEESQAAEPAAESVAAPPPPNPNITWTGIPQVDRDNPTLHRGVVLGPDGAPLAGASVYAASTIELFDLKRVDELGPARAVTDAQGRFEFTAEDLSWVTPGGERKRWETLLVVTREGVVSGWLKTWGEDRSLRSHWHPHVSREIAVRTRPAASLTGTFLLEGGAPLAEARVRLTGLMAPVEYDLERHIPQEEENPLGLFSGVDYAETLYRPDLLPGLVTETTTDPEGRFELPGLPEGFIASIEVSHPQAVTTGLRVAIRAIEAVYRKRMTFETLDTANEASPDADREATPTLYGSGFTKELPPGIVLRGQVVSAEWGDRKTLAGVVVAQANHNSPDGMSGQQFTTDADGRFEITGLSPYPEGYELAFVGSFNVPYRSHRQRIVAGQDANVELQPAVPYRLKLTNPQGEPVERDVYSIEVQQTPGSVRRDIKSRFHDAVQVAPGVYEGIVPTGPAAVLVKRGARADRPVAVDPKAYFEPGRTDWTLEEERYAYGDEWRIVQVGVSETDRLAYNANPAHEQLDLAAAVFTNARKEDGVLKLSATVYSDPPVEFTLVDEAGVLVDSARVERQLERYEDDGLPATFAVHGLHPERAEFLAFYHEERRLIGTLSTTWKSEPIRVVMRPAATLRGRFVDGSGKLDDDFGMRLLGDGVMPDTFVAGRMFNTTEKPGERDGEFWWEVPPGMEVRGEFVRKAPDNRTRPSVGAAFGPLIPQPGETIDLGDLTVP
jgi:Zn-dependent protease with chaperone function